MLYVIVGHTTPLVCIYKHRVETTLYRQKPYQVVSLEYMDAPPPLLPVKVFTI